MLRVEESILSKRKSYFEEDSHLKEKVAKIRQEEEERIRATIANEAARSALGPLTCMIEIIHSNHQTRLSDVPLHNVFQAVQNT